MCYTLVIGGDTLNERILQIIKESKITKTEFAKRINVSQAYVSQLCLSDRTPSDRTISDICRIFRVSEEWLRTGNGEMFVEDTQRDKINHFFQDVLTTAPDERSALVAALDDLPPEFWPVVAELARKYVENLKKK